MASNPVGEFINSLMASKSKGEEEALVRPCVPHMNAYLACSCNHITSAADGAKWRLTDDLPAHKRKGFHRHHQYTSPEGFPEVPRQFLVTSHSEDRDYATYAANSYSSAIAVQELMKKRGF
ncbi:hypothetical protein BBJ28_00009703 [Nothophytophthora sp. Chile5]|nr:hypothetical protein BBJ28_00009703 [Nothophytophthora sp. Chile5]